MRINYPTRSKFLFSCEEAIRQNKSELLKGDSITVRFPPYGYDGKIKVSIEESNLTSFWADWKNPDPTRFPVRIKAGAFALFREKCYGEFIITHKSGILTIQNLSFKINPVDKIKEINKSSNIQKKEKIEEKSNKIFGTDNNTKFNGDIIFSPKTNRFENSDPIVKLLLEYGETIRPQELFPVIHKEAADIIVENPFAFALASVLDRGTKADIIWTIPFYLQKQVGHLTPQTFVKMSSEDLRAVFEELPYKPRYIGDAPRTVKEFSKIVLNEYNGDVTQIWQDKTSNYVKSVFQRIHGVGPGIASMIVILLERCYGIQFKDVDHRNMDVKPDVHIVRVFYRLGLISKQTESEALNAARRLNPEYPGALDTPTWMIGRNWCYANDPRCPECPVNKVCERFSKYNKYKFS